MSTGQNYGAKGSQPSSFELTEGLNPLAVQKAAQPHLQPDHRLFIQSLAGFAGLPVGQLIAAINTQLSEHPLFYTNALTGTALLRALDRLTGGNLPAHYALLLRTDQIVGVVSIPALNMTALPDRRSLLTYHVEETRPLLRAIVESEATRVLLATRRADGGYDLGSDEQLEVNRLRDALELFDVELLDYLLFYPDLNVSWVWNQHRDAGFDEGVSQYDIAYCGIPGEDDDALVMSTTSASR